MTETETAAAPPPEPRSRRHARRVIYVWIFLVAFLLVALGSAIAAATLFPCACGTPTMSPSAAVEPVGGIG